MRQSMCNIIQMMSMKTSFYKGDKCSGEWSDLTMGLGLARPPEWLQENKKLESSVKGTLPQSKNF